MGKGIIRVSKELINEFLMLPEGFNLVGVQMDFQERSLELKYEAELIPKVIDGVLLPDVNVIHYQHTEPLSSEETGSLPGVTKETFLKEISAYGEFEPGVKSIKVLFVLSQKES